MGLIFLAAFIAIPLIEIGLFIQVGHIIGMWPTIFIVIITAFAGTVLLKQQGMNALNRLQQDLNAGKPPMAPVFDGFCLLAAGFLLLTPGFFTDSIGFLLFIPGIRSVLRGFLSRRIKFQHSQTFASHGTTQHPLDFDSASDFDNVIDGDWQDVTPQEPEKSLPPKDSKLDT